MVHGFSTWTAASVPRFHSPSLYSSENTPMEITTNTVVCESRPIFSFEPNTPVFCRPLYHVVNWWWFSPGFFRFFEISSIPVRARPRLEAGRESLWARKHKNQQTRSSERTHTQRNTWTRGRRRSGTPHHSARGSLVQPTSSQGKKQASVRRSSRHAAADSL